LSNPHSAEPITTPKRVVVIGAGIAGLGAAQALNTLARRLNVQTLVVGGDSSYTGG